MMELRHLSQPEDDVTRLALKGRFDLQGAEEIESDFTRQTSSADKSVVVDFSAVPFLASIGMRMLVRVAKVLRQSNRRLVILRPQENVKQALEVAGLVELLPMTDDPTEALMLARNDGAAPRS